MLKGSLRRLPDLFREARRRKVYSAVVAYGAVAVVLIQIGHAVFVDALLLPEWSPRLLTVLLILGFPVVLVFAWMFDIGVEGVRRTERLTPGAGGPVGESGVDSRAAATTPRPSNGGSAIRAIGSGQGVRMAGGAPAQPLLGRRPMPAATHPETGEGHLEEAPAGDVPELPTEAPDPERVRRAALAHARHELRTPIAAIIGYSEMLVEDAEEAGDADAAADLRRIQEGGRELLALVDSILDPEVIAREAGRDLETYGARIRADLRTPTTTVIGYAELLLEAGHAEIEADLQRILTAARRLLDLSHDIVQAATRPEEVQGPAFRGASALTRDVLSKIRPLRPGQEDSDERQGSLLVVDDNAFNRDLLARQLARKGYMVATAENGREGLERLETEDFDLVLLDILMPEMDGLEVLRRIQADPQLRDVPVVMISSLDEIDSAIRCMEAGAADYLTKPFHPTLLDARIGAVLEVRRIRDRESRRRAEIEEADALTFRLALGGCPPSIAARVRAGELGIREEYPETTVLWCDLDHTLRGSARLAPAERIQLLEEYFASVESVARDHGLDTVMLLGTGVVVAGGIPTGPPDHADRVAAVALDAIALLSDAESMARTVGATRAPAPAPAIRFGLHSGPAFGAVLNADRLAFHVWGDAVDLARRLEANAEPGTIHASPTVHTMLKDRFTFTRRGVVEVAGRGQMQTYLLGGRVTAPAGG